MVSSMVSVRIGRLLFEHFLFVHFVLRMGFVGRRVSRYMAFLTALLDCVCSIDGDSDSTVIAPLRIMHSITPPLVCSFFSFDAHPLRAEHGCAWTLTLKYTTPHRITPHHVRQDCRCDGVRMSRSPTIASSS